MSWHHPIGRFAQTACVWEVCARKPGNVNRSFDFPETGLTDFLLSAATLGPLLDTMRSHNVGITVHEAIRMRQQVASTNTNLGIVLLLVPLAKAAACPDFRPAARRVLEQLSPDDAELVFEAIRLAGAGALGEVPTADVREKPTLPLREAMALAADRDLVARQYANGFREVFDEGVPAFVDGFRQTGSVEEAIILCQLRLMAAHPDSLIARKCGLALAEESRGRAGEILRSGWPDTAAGWTALHEFDSWLRGDGHQRNPGTTADLVTASLFVALREGSVEIKSHFPWRDGVPGRRPGRTE